MEQTLAQHSLLLPIERPAFVWVPGVQSRPAHGAGPFCRKTVQRCTTVCLAKPLNKPGAKKFSGGRQDDLMEKFLAARSAKPQEKDQPAPAAPTPTRTMPPAAGPQQTASLRSPPAKTQSTTASAAQQRPRDGDQVKAALKANKNWRFEDQHEDVMDLDRDALRREIDEFIQPPPPQELAAREVAEYDRFQSFLEGGQDALQMRQATVKEQETVLQEEEVLYRPGEFAPLDAWSELQDIDGVRVNFNKFREGQKPIVVLADPRSGSTDFRQAVTALNAEFPKQLGTLVTVNRETPAINRKFVKKSGLTVPVLCDQEKRWLNSYLVTALHPWEKMVFIIDPEYGKFLAVMRAPNSYGLAELLKTQLTNLANNQGV